MRGFLAFRWMDLFQVESEILKMNGMMMDDTGKNMSVAFGPS